MFQQVFQQVCDAASPSCVLSLRGSSLTRATAYSDTSTASRWANWRKHATTALRRYRYELHRFTCIQYKHIPNLTNTEISGEGKKKKDYWKNRVCADSTCWSGYNDKQTEKIRFKKKKSSAVIWPTSCGNQNPYNPGTSPWKTHFLYRQEKSQKGERLKYKGAGLLPRLLLGQMISLTLHSRLQVTNWNVAFNFWCTLPDHNTRVFVCLVFFLNSHSRFSSPSLLLL